MIILCKHCGKEVERTINRPATCFPCRKKSKTDYFLHKYHTDKRFRKKILDYGKKIRKLRRLNRIKN